MLPKKISAENKKIAKRKILPKEKFCQKNSERKNFAKKICLKKFATKKLPKNICHKKFLPKVFFSTKKNFPPKVFSINKTKFSPEKKVSKKNLSKKRCCQKKISKKNYRKNFCGKIFLQFFSLQSLIIF